MGSSLQHSGSPNDQNRKNLGFVQRYCSRQCCRWQAAEPDGQHDFDFNFGKWNPRELAGISALWLEHLAEYDGVSVVPGLGRACQSLRS